jgi:hypothetical protein
MNRRYLYVGHSVASDNAGDMPLRVGLGEAHSRNLHPDMRALDLKPDTEVEQVDFDEDRQLHILEWEDESGTPRRTSVEPDVFENYFEEL